MFSLSPVQYFWSQLPSVLAYGSLVVSLGLLLAALGLFAQTFQSLITVLALSLLLTYLLYLPVNWMERGLVGLTRLLRMRVYDRPVRLPFFQPRFVAVVIVVGVSALLLLAAFTSLIPSATHQISDFIQHLPTYLQRLQTELSHWLPRLPWLSEWLPSLSGQTPPSPTAAVSPAVVASTPFKPPSAQAVPVDSQWLGVVGGYFLDLVGKTFHQLFHWLAMVMLSFYWLLDGKRLLTGLLNWLPASWQSTTRELAGQCHEVMLSFVKGQVLLGLLTGVYMGIVYSLFGVKYALILALWFALAELIPVVGTWLGITPGLIIALVTTDPLTTLYVWLSSYAYQNVKDNIIQPKIAGDLMGLHPLGILLALLLGSQLAGLLGVVLALPTAAILNRLLPYVIQWLNEPPPPLGEERLIAEEGLS